MSSDYVYTMYRADKFYGPERQVLANISLSFLPGAKIGVLGPNGAGKSTLLRIMAGLEEPSSGLAELAPGATVGFLPQEPELDPAKDVRGNVEDGVRRAAGPARPVQRALPALRRADVRRRDERAPRRAGARAGRDRPRATPGRSTRRSTPRWTRSAARRATRTSPLSPAASAAASRSAGCSSSSPDLLLLDEPTNHLDAESVAWLERFLERYRGTVMAVTHDRYFLDNVAGWILELDRGQGLPFQGNYSSWLEQKEARLGAEEKQASARRRTLAARARVGTHEPEGASREVEGAPRRVRASCWPRTQSVKLDRVEIHIPAGPAPRRRRGRGGATFGRASATGC